MIEEHRERALDRLAELDAAEHVRELLDGARHLVADAQAEPDPHAAIGRLATSLGRLLDALDQVLPLIGD
jgi:hypothetical protein